MTGCGRALCASHVGLFDGKMLCSVCYELHRSKCRCGKPAFAKPCRDCHEPFCEDHGGTILWQWNPATRRDDIQTNDDQCVECRNREYERSIRRARARPLEFIAAMKEYSIAGTSLPIVEEKFGSGGLFGSPKDILSYTNAWRVSLFGSGREDHKPPLYLDDHGMFFGYTVIFRRRFIRDSESISALYRLPDRLISSDVPYIDWGRVRAEYGKGFGSELAHRFRVALRDAYE